MSLRIPWSSRCEAPMVVRRKVQVEEVVGCKVYEAKAVQSLP